METPSHPISIRHENPGDHAAITDLVERAFLGKPYSQGAEANIVSALRDAHALTLSLVAKLDGQLVGHIAFSPVSISDGTAGWYGLGPLAVLPDYQQMGIGSALVQRGLADIREAGAAGCVLLGDPGYYSRFEFAVNHNLILPDVPPEYFLVMPFSGVIPRGEVAYHASFDTTSAIET